MTAMIMSCTLTCSKGPFGTVVDQRLLSQVSGMKPADVAMATPTQSDKEPHRHQSHPRPSLQFNHPPTYGVSKTHPPKR
jgi:hypothetical protein